LVGAIVVVLLSASSAFAGPFEDAVAAYDQKDYATALRLFQSLAEQGDAKASALRFAGRFAPENAFAFVPWIGTEEIARAAEGGQGGLSTAALAAASYAAKRAASQMTRNQANLAEALVRAQSPSGRAIGAMQSLPAPFRPYPLVTGTTAAALPPAWTWATNQQ
jgi:hypothetical protein